MRGSSVKKTVSWLLIFAIMALSTGCTTTHRIQTSELEKLNGYRADGEQPTLVTEDRKTIAFREDASLSLIFETGERFVATYRSIVVEEGRFSGNTFEGESVNFELGEIDSALVKHPDESSSKVALIAVGAVVVAVVGLAAIVWYAGEAASAGGS